MHACSLVENCDTSVTEIEESLTEVVSLPSDVTQTWIGGSVKEVEERIAQLSEGHQLLEGDEVRAKVRNRLFLVLSFFKISLRNHSV